MSKLKVLTDKDPILRKKSLEIKKDDILKYQKLAENMKQTMEEENGIGLAAPQVGQSIRMICINKEANDDQDHLILINPKITFSSKDCDIQEEGCLSVPETFGEVKRPNKIRIKALDLEGNKIQLKAKGIFARVLQHEIDHLDGILFIDKLEI